MSTTKLLSIKFGKSIEEIEELRNGHGSAPVIWDALAQKYFGSNPFQYSQFLDRLWPLYKDKTIPMHHRAVLMMTFDYAYIKRKNFNRAADNINKFLNEFPSNEGRVNHWPRIAEVLRSEDCSNFCIYHTSVSENPFIEYGNRDGFKVRKKKDCYEIYEELDSL